MKLAEEVPIASTSCADPDNSVWGRGGGGPENFRFVIIVFYRGPDGPLSKSNRT